VARAKQIPHIVTSCPSASGTNAWPIQMQGQGVTTLVVSLPLKYMHSPVEMLRMSDVKNVGKLLAAFIETFDGRL
jgi:endoglucanase